MGMYTHQQPLRLHYCRQQEQEHVHEVQGSVQTAEITEDPHNHRFATVTGEARPPHSKEHVHDVAFRTDTYEDHFHVFSGTTGGAVPVGGGRHGHFLRSVTQESDGHVHTFRFATLIEDPIGD
jgi:hypothetical protein